MSALTDELEPTVQGRSTGQGRVFQSVRDQYISEHHHHYTADPASIFDLPAQSGPVRVPSAGGPAGVPAPASVRMPLIGRAPAILRDRRELVPGLLRAAGHERGGVHVLHGLGGCGKTAVAHEVFNKVASPAGRIGLWVNASDAATVRAGMMAVAADRGAGAAELAAAFDGRRAAADLVWHYLDHSSRPWLLVLDNADDPAVLGDGTWLRHSPQGTVLVTSRQPYSPVWAGATLHRVDVLPPADAAQVLRDLAPHSGTAEEAEAVARRLDCLPLALTLAGSFLSNQILESWSMDEYRRRLDEDPTDLLDQGGGPGLTDRNARQLVSRTWELSLSALADAGVPESVTLLGLLSCWSSDPVPVSLLHGAAVDAVDLTALEPPLPGSRVETALRGLMSHSLVSLVEVEGEAGTTRCVKTHGVLLDSVAAAVPDEQKAPLLRAAAQLLERGLDAPVGPGSLVSHVVGLLRKAQAAGETAPVEVGVLAARRLFDRGDFHGALLVAEATAETAQRLSGPEHRPTLRAEHIAGLALFRLGRFQESEALHRRVLETSERVLGPDDPQTLESLQYIHEPLGQLQRLAESVDTLRRVQERRTELQGPKHPATLHTRALLIEYLAMSGAVEEFDRVGPATVADCEQVLGADSLSTVTAAHNYAFGLFRFDRFEQAEPIARRALAGRELVHGPEHALTLSAAVLLSWILERRGLLGEAVGLARRALTGQETSLGAEHPYVLANRTRLAAFLAASGETAEAAALARRNLPLCERLLGVDHALTEETRGLIGQEPEPGTH
ncbi:tetratricopeptide repeat protein [Streptomyces zhihengii]|uniref:tetratricopeptide repeat protein n=1 Tax=Streptomyces zhihengii TaxID=1818004 RepID=UPI003627F258